MGMFGGPFGSDDDADHVDEKKAGQYEETRIEFLFASLVGDMRFKEAASIIRKIERRGRRRWLKRVWRRIVGRVGKWRRRLTRRLGMALVAIGNRFKSEQEWTHDERVELMLDRLCHTESFKKQVALAVQPPAYVARPGPSGAIA